MRRHEILERLNANTSYDVVDDKTDRVFATMDSLQEAKAEKERLERAHKGSKFRIEKNLGGN